MRAFHKALPPFFTRDYFPDSQPNEAEETYDCYCIINVSLSCCECCAEVIAPPHYPSLQKHAAGDCERWRTLNLVWALIPRSRMCRLRFLHKENPFEPLAAGVRRNAPRPIGGRRPRLPGRRHGGTMLSKQLVFALPACSNTTF